MKKQNITACRASIRKYNALIKDYVSMGLLEEKLKVIYDLRAEAQERLNHLTMCKLEEMESPKKKTKATQGKAVKIKKPTR